MPNPCCVFLLWVGQTSNCTAFGVACLPGETITFFAQPFGTTFACVTEFEWTFGDGTTARTTVPSIAHTFTQPGNYSVTLRLTVKNFGPLLFTTRRNLLVAAEGIPALSTITLCSLGVVLLVIGFRATHNVL